jgi:hypothetical protein
MDKSIKKVSLATLKRRKAQHLQESEKKDKHSKEKPLFKSLQEMKAAYAQEKESGSALRSKSIFS